MVVSVFYTDLDVTRRSGSIRKRNDPDLRSEFARDRDRVLYASALLRLAGKTQVVSAGEPGLYHNRLTHTMKVAQLGRRAAERLRTIFAASLGDAAPRAGVLLPPDPDLVEAACWAHDLGHPPFGHAGEEALKAALDARLHRPPSRQDIENSGFEGNAQTFRIIVFLATRRGSTRRQYGLDLTRATLDATVKYPTLRSKLDQRKWGAYGHDKGALNFVRGHAPDRRKCFEAQLMDWCDDVTYAVHDVIDCYRAHLIPLHQLFHNTPSKGRSFTPTTEASQFLEWLENSYSNANHNVHPELAALSPAERIQHWAELENFFLKISRPFTPLRSIKAEINGLAGDLFGHLMDGLTWVDGDAPCRYRANLSYDVSPEVSMKKRIHCSLLQELPWYYVIRDRRLATQQHGQQLMIQALVDYHLDAGERLELLLPRDRAQEYEQHEDPARAVADHIASLTERDAAALYARLSGVQIGAITDAV